MRKMHGSMMDAAVPRAGDLFRSQQRLATAVLPASPNEKRAPPPVARAESLWLLLQHLASSQSAQAAETVAALPAFAFDVSAVREAWAMGEAVLNQWWSLHAQWMEGLAELGQEMGEIRQANTVSKYVDQEMNLVQQGLALLSSQATAAARLAENVQVNAVWLVHQRARGRKG